MKLKDLWVGRYVVFQDGVVGCVTQIHITYDESQPWAKKPMFVEVGVSTPGNARDGWATTYTRHGAYPAAKIEDTEFSELSVTIPGYFDSRATAEFAGTPKEEAY